MVSRSEAVAQSLASARLEGMEPPAETLAVTQAWARGELSDADLDAYVASELALAREVASAGRAAAAA